jgi:hypothetical protein
MTASETANFTCAAMNQLTHTVIQESSGCYKSDQKKKIHENSRKSWRDKAMGSGISV